MADLNSAAIEQAIHQGESLGVDGLFQLLERYHDDGGHGIRRDVLLAYAEELEAKDAIRVDADAFVEAIDDRTVDDTSWVGTDAVYPLGDDRLSRFPADWHDRLGGSTDARAYVEFLHDEVPDFKASVSHGGAGTGVPKEELIEIMTVVGRMDREDAKDALDDARGRGDLVEDADQHPEANVELPENTEGERDSLLD